MIKFFDRHYYNIFYSYFMLVVFYCLARIIVPLQFISANLYLTIFMTGSGILLSFYNIFIKKVYLYAKYIEYLILFAIINLFTMISVLSYGYSNNLKHYAVFFIYFFVIYSTYFLIDKKKSAKLYNSTMWLISILQSIGVFISLIQFFLIISYKIVDYRGITLRQGFVESRLFGILASPNYNSVVSLIVVIFCIYIIRQNDKFRYPSYFLVIINFVYIVLSGSRTTFLCMVAGLFIYLLLLSLNRKNLKKSIISFILGFLILFTSYYGTKIITNKYLHLASRTIVTDNQDTAQDISLDRNDTSSSNISNNRFAIWKGTLDMVPHKPIIGVSSGYWLEVSRDYDKDNYIVTREYLPHNGYIELLFYNGILGFVIMGIFISKSVKNAIINIYRTNSKLLNDKLQLFLILLTILIANMFLSSTLYGMMMLGTILFTTLGRFNSAYSFDFDSYVELSMDEVKKIELDILKYIHKICEKNSINYHIAYGTLLGAVRHKGFIPWDDDIDIAMLRADYEKFYNVMLKEQDDIYKVISYKNNKKYNLPFFRIYDSRTIYENNYLRDENFKLGICVDVFAFDQYKNLSKKISFFNKARQLSSFSFYGLRNEKISEFKNLPRYIASLFFRWTTPAKWIKKMDDLAKEPSSSDFVDYILEEKKKDTRLEAFIFSESILLDFEGHKFYAPKNYDKVLKTIYGDGYMKIPDEKDRKSIHAQFNAFIKK